MFSPRGGRRSHRFLNWQLGLFFVAAAIWLVGLLAGLRRLTLLSITLLLVAIVLGMIARRGEEG